MDIRRSIQPIKDVFNACTKEAFSLNRKNAFSGFEEIAAVWKPLDRMTPIIARWHMTEWCNYSCHYCYQEHSRKRIIRIEEDETYYAHAFDNFTADNWIDAFKNLADKHLISLTITGGEPFLDRENMGLFLSEMAGDKNIDSIRLDTNASWDPKHYRGMNKTKIYLMCTFHPSRVRVDTFIKNIEAIMAEGFNVVMVNFVMAPQQMMDFKRLKELFQEIHIPLSANPLIGGPDLSDAEFEFLKNVSNEFDLAYKGRFTSPKGKRCFYPAVAYEIDMSGQMITGCHPDHKGNIIHKVYPRLFDAPVVCHADFCTCADKYSFLEGCLRNTSLNTLVEFSKYIPQHGDSE